MGFKYYAFKLSGICIVIFAIQLFVSGFTDFFVLNSLAWSQPWRFLTSIFLHGGIGHLFYNLFALLFFGSVLEKFIGGRRFLVVFFVSGILANVVSVNFYSSSLGASGAIFGVIGALIIVRPSQVIWAFGLPMPIFIAGILWGIGDALGAVAFLLGNPINNTGNLAHLSGMFFGIVLGFFFRDWNSRKTKNRRLELDEEYVRRWEDAYLR